ncbi:hypothetical protein SAMN05216480_11217 [Pustulibacterium marinum]|uniref:Helix-hairpin-helix domain-containing protein n=1 Tax=Pustulibacterium marinum TaxID=1224947 RepID=A0A1I7I048_9FLAO|nr:hypothetical protein [Pustulibacterium marinum]SFU66277.1 hypothetical protein SAMN05216480_11217 [Pustulibacterium marinum]
MFYVITPSTILDYVILLSICLFGFAIGFFLAMAKFKSLQSTTSETEIRTENNYVVSNFGVPGQIKAVKTYERGMYVKSEPQEDYQPEDNALEKDDLKKLKGIGPTVERRFNEIGYFTFNQLTALQQEDKKTISQILSFLPNQVKIEDICSQAKLLCTAEKVSA